MSKRISRCAAAPPTTALMTRFYPELKAGKPKATTLRESMLATQKQFPNPLDGSAFTLVGNPD
ncbi:MAG: hypothetical protein HC860_17130 [Alkalinema sp. RU_4_3]|nr:hypothetical protein [Alkalinema sp. RU_4_3]